ncbi:MAG: hypothetical protein M1491_00105, partial [Deltaproteobacteria bacterium]|nr:hypothetical protein [Deltaproteobacteria bacterium]
MQMATDKSPGLTIPFRYLFTGMAVLVAMSVIVVLRAHALTGYFFRSPVFLALTHLLTLGWITLTIMGAMFQLVPVVTERALFSVAISRVVYYVYCAGLVLLIYAFASNTEAGAGAGVVGVAVVLFLFDIGVTMFRPGEQGRAVAGPGAGSPPDTTKGTGRPDLAVWYVRAAMVSLLLTIVIGPVAAAGLHARITDDPFALLTLHMAVAGIGWVCFAVIGFSLRLIPMFILSHGYEETYGWTSFVMLLSGLVLFVLYCTLRLLIPGLAGIDWVGLAGGMTMLIGIVCYVLQMRVIYGQRTRRQIEPAVWFSICATAYLLIAGVTGVWMLA